MNTVFSRPWVPNIFERPVAQRAAVSIQPDSVTFGAKPEKDEARLSTKKRKAKLRHVAVAGLASVPLVLQLLVGVKPASAAQAKPDTQADDPTVSEAADQYASDAVSIEAAVVNSAEDVPLVPEGSSQHVIDLAQNPLLSAEAHVYINTELEMVSRANRAGDFYVVVVPDTNRVAEELAREINQRLNPDGDGGVLLLNARELRENHKDTREVHHHVRQVCTGSGSSRSCHLQPYTTVHYYVRDGMMEVAQGQQMFDELAEQLREAGPRIRVEDSRRLERQYDKIQEQFTENPAEVREAFARYFAAKLQNSRSAQGHEIYRQDYDLAAMNVAENIRALYEDPVFRYVQSQANSQLAITILLAALGVIGVSVGGVFAYNAIQDARDYGSFRRRY